MTKITFFRRSGRFVGFCAEGHSGFSDEGSDIVCAAVSAVTQTAAIQAEEILGMKGAATSDEEGATLKVVGDGGEPWHCAVAAAEIFLSALSEQYPEHVSTTITEV